MKVKRSKIFLKMRKFVFLIIIFTSSVGCDKEPPEGVTDPGQLLYLGYLKEEVDCVRCHGPEGAGGMQAPDIRTVFKKYDESKIVEIIKFGQGKGSNKMPSFNEKLNEEDIIALLKFLKTLKPFPPNAKQFSN